MSMTPVLCVQASQGSHHCPPSSNSAEPGKRVLDIWNLPQSSQWERCISPPALALAALADQYSASESDCLASKCCHPSNADRASAAQTAASEERSKEMEAKAAQCSDFMSTLSPCRRGWQGNPARREEDGEGRASPAQAGPAVHGVSCSCPQPGQCQCCHEGNGRLLRMGFFMSCKMKTAETS
jgi:hypothetical protein